MAQPLYIIPPVGSKGFFTFAAPFNTLALPDDEYTCRAVRNLSDYVNNNEDALSLVYLQSGLTTTDYQNDLAAGMVIVSLQSQVGHWLYVPVRFIDSLPQSSGVPYQNKVIAINLGAVPAEQDFTALQTALTNAVADMYGVTPQIQVVVTSKTSLVPYTTDQQIQQARQGRITMATTESAQVKILQTQNASLQTKLNALEAYILANKTALGI